jgi:hypothetical protein
MSSKGTSVATYTYTGKDKSDWAHLWSAFKLNLNKKDIAYIMVEAEVTQRLQPPEIPVPVAIPAEENVNERTVREFQQDLAMNEYKELAKLHRKYTKEVPKVYGRTGL